MLLVSQRSFTMKFKGATQISLIKSQLTSNTSLFSLFVEAP